MTIRIAAHTATLPQNGSSVSLSVLTSRTGANTPIRFDWVNDLTPHLLAVFLVNKQYHYSHIWDLFQNKIFTRQCEEGEKIRLK